MLGALTPSFPQRSRFQAHPLSRAVAGALQVAPEQTPCLSRPYQQHPHCHHGCSTRGDRAVHQDDVVFADVLWQPQVVELGGGKRKQLRGCRQMERPEPFSLRREGSLLPLCPWDPGLSTQLAQTSPCVPASKTHLSSFQSTQPLPRQTPGLLKSCQETPEPRPHPARRLTPGDVPSGPGLYLWLAGVAVGLDEDGADADVLAHGAQRWLHGLSRSQDGHPGDLQHTAGVVSQCRSCHHPTLGLSSGGL